MVDSECVSQHACLGTDAKNVCLHKTLVHQASRQITTIYRAVHVTHLKIRQKVDEQGTAVLIDHGQSAAELRYPLKASSQILFRINPPFRRLGGDGIR